MFHFVTIIILILFYAIYVGKMVMQRRKGIQTDQIARGKKSKVIFVTELIMKCATYCIVIVEIVSIYLSTTVPCLFLKTVGAILGVVGVVVFGIAVHAMRDSWRAGIPENDKTELVTTGIFKISRNPAFLAFDLVYLGILFMYFNWILLLFTIWAIIMLHLQIKQEEKFLLATFGEDYTKYKKQTRRYFGK